MKTTNTLGSGIAPLKFISRAFVATMFAIFVIFSPQAQACDVHHNIYASSSSYGTGTFSVTLTVGKHNNGDDNYKLAKSIVSLQFSNTSNITSYNSCTILGSFASAGYSVDGTPSYNSSTGILTIVIKSPGQSSSVNITSATPVDYISIKMNATNSGTTNITFPTSSHLNEEEDYKYWKDCSEENVCELRTSDLSNQPLPVTWLSVDAKIDGTKNVVNWATATENNNDRFEIERTVDGKIFTTIGTVKGIGNSNQNIYYKFIDNMPVKDCFYRLKQIDFDGKFDYSALIVPRETDLGKVPEISLYPNPASNEDVIMISLKKLAPKSYLVVTDAYGKIIFQTNFEDAEASMTLPNLATGYYIVTVFNTKNVLNRKITVINKD